MRVDRCQLSSNSARAKFYFDIYMHSIGELMCADITQVFHLKFMNFSLIINSIC